MWRYETSIDLHHQTWISNTSSLSMLIFKARFNPFHRILAFWFECLSAFIAFGTCHCCITHMVYIDQKLRHMPETRKIDSRHGSWMYKWIFDDIGKWQFRPQRIKKTCQVRMSDTTIQKYMQVCMVLQPDVCRMQNVGYTRVRTYITESNLEIYTSMPSTRIEFIQGRQFHPI